jgi:hypothetical protein
METVLTLTTPPGLGWIGWLMQKRFGARHYIWEMDVYPDVASALGVVREGSWTGRALRVVLDFPRRRADGVIVSSCSASACGTA